MLTNAHTHTHTHTPTPSTDTHYLHSWRDYANITCNTQSQQYEDNINRSMTIPSTLQTKTPPVQVHDTLGQQ